MLNALLWFLVGVLVAVIVLYVLHLFLSYIGADAELKRLLMVCIGLIMLVLVLFLAIRAASGPGPVWP